MRVRIEVKEFFESKGFEVEYVPRGSDKQSRFFGERERLYTINL